MKFKVILMTFLILVSSILFNTAYCNPKTSGETIEVFNVPDGNGLGLAFMPLTSFTAVNCNINNQSAEQPVSLHQSTFFDFTLIPMCGNVTSNFTLSVRDVVTGKLYTCPQTIPHDNSGPDGNWRASLTLSPGAQVHLTCELRKLSS